MKKFLTIFALFVLILPISASAFTVQSAPDINISGDQIIEDNLYLLGGNINFDNTLDNDLVVISGQSNIKGVVFGDAQIISGSTIFSGEVFGDARILSSEVNISSNTNGDLVIIAGKVFFNENSILNGDTIIVAGEVNLQGKVLGDLKIVAGKVNIGAEISGNTEITTQKLNINSSTNVTGDFLYFSPEKANVMDGSYLGENFIYNQIESIGENEFIKRTLLSFISFWSIIKFLATLFTAFVLVFVFRVFSQKTSEIAVSQMPKAFLIGLLSILLIPIASLILFASLFALPISIIIFLIYIMVLLLTPAISGMIVGYLINKYFRKNIKLEVDFNSAALGVIVLTFVYFIPYVGGVLRTFFIFLSFGSVMLYYFDYLITRKKR